jgi:hypothetical protein
VLTRVPAVVEFRVPLAVIVGGVKVQVASEGRPEQPRLIVPPKTVELEMLTDVVPEPPGAEIGTACVDGIAAKNPGVAPTSYSSAPGCTSDCLQRST